ncbi:hypothetical protein FHX74_002020 [Friedmanniella endophytica]|uniref:PspA-associated domain-containing protein n=1 Tax=Microlunatus kandeliicorticis TaxID=1759536 RepID=A0A7W3P5V9_9ACTN|nr:hypothetical protein [Microlunatus kandeliicorticis]MBA8794401.1 hypothetical protein [Microlunatus kandeliicorticis]
MIVRILNEGQFELGDSAVNQLNTVDDAIEWAVNAGNQEELTKALHSLHEQVRAAGVPVPDDQLVDSDLILPAADATLAEVAELLGESQDGLIPG